MKKITAIMLVILSTVAIVEAQTLKKVPQEQKDVIVRSIAGNVSAVKSIQCDFRQEKSVSLLNDKVVSKGRMYFSDGNLRWEYLTPYSYVFLVNGQDVVVKSDDKTTKMDSRSGQLYKRIAPLMANTISGSNLVQNNDFNVEVYENGSKYVAKLVPVQARMKKMFSEISLYFNNNQNIVEKIVIAEASGDKTTIEILNAKTNVKVPDSVFKP